MKRIITIALCVLFGIVGMAHAQSVEYDYAFTYIDTRVAFVNYYDANSTKYETRVGIPLDMTDPNDVIDYLSTPTMLELILVNIRHAEYPNLPVMDTWAQMLDPNNWTDISFICDPNGWMSDPNWVFDPNTNNSYLWCQNEDNWYKDPNSYGDPNFYLQYVEYPANYNPNYTQTIAAIDADESISPLIKTLWKKQIKLDIKWIVFE